MADEKIYVVLLNCVLVWKLAERDVVHDGVLARHTLQLDSGDLQAGGLYVRKYGRGGGGMKRWTKEQKMEEKGKI